MFIEFTRPIINPCPKCGKSGGQLYPTLNGGKIRVECPECGFCSSTPGRDFREAIQIWNKTALVKKSIYAKEVICMPSQDKNNQYKRVTAVCPHYRSSTSQLIRCGDIPDVALIQIAFGSRTLRKEHEDRYCCDRYERCPFMKLR